MWIFIGRVRPAVTIGGSVLKEDEIRESTETTHSSVPSLEEILKELDNKLQEEEKPREEMAEQPQPLRPRRRQTKKGKKEEDLSWQENLMLTLHDVVTLFAVVMVTFVLLFRIVVVDGSSMYSTLWHNDYLLVMSNVICGDFEAGDIIVASKDSFNDGEPIIKRVIATEGQTVDIDFEAGIVYVDGVALEEEYTNTPTNISEGVAFPLTVADGCIFAMGDNRNRSRDSRYPDIGLIDQREVLGKAVFILLPGTGDGDNEAPRDFSRIGVLK